MEKSTVTIEIKQEVSILLLWIVGGIIIVTIAFFIPPSSTELWPQFYAGGIAAIIYIIALLIYAVRKPVSIKARIITVGCFVIVLGALVFSSIQSDSHAHRQIEHLMQERGFIGRGIMTYKIPQPLFKTLKVFHEQGSIKKETIAQIFQRLNNNASVGSNINKPEYEGDSLKIFVQALERDTIILVSQETFVKGKNLQFKNYNGQEGMIQEKCTLTIKGLVYESEN
jgi:uncharacterized membrane protein YvlD (DUF360 family)